MKKQILILSLFMLAIFAGISSVFAQAVHDSDPRGHACTDDALHPIAGKSYDYTASSNEDGNFTFWATQDPNFITTDGSGVTTTNIDDMLTSPTTTPTGTDLMATSSNYGVATNATAGDATVSITWSDAILGATTTTTPTFVAVLKDGDCTNNFEAWAIEPIEAFTVDILNLENSALTALAYDAQDDQCYDEVRGATYDSGSGQINYDFGTQVLYYEVIAANFSASYTPTFTLSGLQTGQSATIEWAYDDAFTSPVTVTSGTASATPVTTNEVNTAQGVSIYVRVTISNATYEGLTDTPITLAVDGQNSVGDWDIENGDGTLCNATTSADQADTAIQNLTARPDVTPTSPNTFVPGDDSDN